MSGRVAAEPPYSLPGQAVCDALRSQCIMVEIKNRLIYIETRLSAGRANVNGIMVINCLLPYLHRFRRNVHFREFSGQIAAIDASCWIHKALSVSISQSRNRER